MFCPLSDSLTSRSATSLLKDGLPAGAKLGRLVRFNLGAPLVLSPPLVELASDDVLPEELSVAAGSWYLVRSTLLVFLFLYGFAVMNQSLSILIN